MFHEQQIIVNIKMRFCKHLMGPFWYAESRESKTQERWSWLHRDKPCFIGRDVVISQNIPGGRGWMVIGFYIYSHCFVCKNKTEQGVTPPTTCSLRQCKSRQGRKQYIQAVSGCSQMESLN